MNHRRRNHIRGVLAEYVALGWLLLKGYRFVTMRYKTPVGEVDLIVRTRRHLVFVEVKSRRSREEALQSIHRRNQSRVMRAAQHFIVSAPEFSPLQVRFDVCLLAWYRWPHHIAHAFTA